MDEYSNLGIIKFESPKKFDFKYSELPQEEFLNFYLLDRHNSDSLEFRNEFTSNVTLSNLTYGYNDQVNQQNDQIYFSEIFQISPMSKISKRMNYEISKETRITSSEIMKKNKNFPCSQCDKVYKSKENQTLHFRNIHLKQKPYSCKYCSSVFSHRNGKTYHERKFHTKYLPHKCIYDDCQSSFASKSALNYHLKSQHLYIGKRYDKDNSNLETKS